MPPVKSSEAGGVGALHQTSVAFNYTTISVCPARMQRRR